MHEETEVPNHFFASVFNGKHSSHTSIKDGQQDRDWGSKVLPTVRQDQVCNHLRNIIMHNSMGPDEMHAILMRKLTDVVAKPLFTVFEKSWQSEEVSGDWKGGNTESIFKRPERGTLAMTDLSSPLCAWEDDGTDLSRSCAKAHGGQGCESQGQVLSDQPSGLL